MANVTAITKQPGSDPFHETADRCDETGEHDQENPQWVRHDQADESLSRCKDDVPGTRSEGDGDGERNREVQSTAQNPLHAPDLTTIDMKANETDRKHHRKPGTCIRPTSGLHLHAHPGHLSHPGGRPPLDHPSSARPSANHSPCPSFYPQETPGSPRRRPRHGRPPLHRHLALPLPLPHTGRSPRRLTTRQTSLPALAPALARRAAALAGNLLPPAPHRLPGMAEQRGSGRRRARVRRGGDVTGPRACAVAPVSRALVRGGAGACAEDAHEGVRALEVERRFVVAESVALRDGRRGKGGETRKGGLRRARIEDRSWNRWAMGQCAGLDSQGPFECRVQHDRWPRFRDAAPHSLPQKSLDAIVHRARRIEPVPRIQEADHQPIGPPQHPLQTSLPGIPPQHFQATPQSPKGVGFAGVDMAKDVHRGSHTPDLGQQVFTTQGCRQIQVEFRRGVRHKDIRVGGDGVRPRVGAAWVLKGELVATASRDLWRPVDVQDTGPGVEGQAHAGVLQVAHALPVQRVQPVRRRQGRPAAGIEEGVVVAGDGDLVLVRKAVKPVDLSLEFRRSASVGEIASVDQEVAIWNVRGDETVSVGDADNADGGRAWWRDATQERKGEVKKLQEELERLRQCDVEERRGSKSLETLSNPQALASCSQARPASDDKTKARERLAILIHCLAQIGLSTEVRNGENHSILVFVRADSDEHMFGQIYRERARDFIHGVRSHEPSKEMSAALQKDPLTAAERLRVIYQLMTAPESEGGAGITPKKGEWENVENIFALHDHVYNKEWIKRWSTRWLLQPQDLDDIRDRLGEKIAMYFALLRKR
nr:uncharacterized protein CFP56_21875 [Quercus suber]